MGTAPAGTPPQIVLASHPESVRFAREFAHEYVMERAPSIPAAKLGELLLIVSELVTNAIQHGTVPGDSILLVLTVGDGVAQVDVHDPERRHPILHLAPEDRDAEGGRGLLLVNLLAHSWGHCGHQTGKRVWAVVTWT